jgi:hypothetical protein
MRWTHEERAVHVALWRESGLSKAAYCRAAELPYQSFYLWCRESEVEITTQSEAGDFIELTADRAITAKNYPPTGLTVRVSEGCELSFAAQCSADWVVAVVRGLRGC